MKTLTTIGLMSGTSTDGISAALVRLTPTRNGYRQRLLAFRTTAFARELRARLLRCAEGEPLAAAQLSELNVALGAALAAAAIEVARSAAVSLARVDLIGSHGHTVFHGPPGSGRSKPPSTLQIGEPAVIAARTGVTVVADFRPADVAAGGQGAPLAPYAHWLLFADARRGRAIHNLGGIANLTYLPPRGSLDEISAFDTGPANMIIDALVTHFSKGKQRFDRDGRIAARGKVDRALLDELLRHPYLRRRPPKSTGREEFGSELVASILARGRRFRLVPDDLIATATAFTAESVADAYRRFVLPRGPLESIHFAGGGAHNRTLLRFVAERLPGVRIGRLEELGVGSDSLEAVAFAVLACETIRGRPGNAPAATGAARRTVLGKIIPGDATRWRRLLR